MAILLMKDLRSEQKMNERELPQLINMTSFLNNAKVLLEESFNSDFNVSFASDVPTEKSEGYTAITFNNKDINMQLVANTYDLPSDFRHGDEGKFFTEGLENALNRIDVNDEEVGRKVGITATSLNKILSGNKTRDLGSVEEHQVRNLVRYTKDPNYVRDKKVVENEKIRATREANKRNEQFNTKGKHTISKSERVR